jgi:hypothetical protein
VCYDLCFKPGELEWVSSFQVQPVLFSCTADSSACSASRSRAGGSSIYSKAIVDLNLLMCCTDGSQLVAGVGARVLIYDASDGKLQHVLKGHKVRCCCDVQGSAA